MKDEHLDSLYKTTFSGKSDSEIVDRWDEFEIRLQRKMFYKFSWNRFNIYYLLLLAGAIAAAAVILLNNRPEPVDHVDTASTATTNTQVDEKEQSTHQQTENSEVVKSNTTNSNNRNKSVTSVHDSTEPSKISPDLSSSENNKKVASDSVISKLTVVQPDSTKPVLVKRKKILYVAKRDTIVNIDTVKVKKSKAK